MTSAFEQLPAEIQLEIFNHVFPTIRVQEKRFPACGIRRKSLKKRCRTKGCDFCTPQEPFHLWLVSRCLTESLRNWLKTRPIVVCIPRRWGYNDLYLNLIDYGLPERAMTNVTEVRIACYSFYHDLDILKDVVIRSKNLHTFRILPLWDKSLDTSPLRKNILLKVYENWAGGTSGSREQQSNLIKFTPGKWTALGKIADILRHRIGQRRMEVLGSLLFYIAVWKRGKSEPLMIYQFKGVSLRWFFFRRLTSIQLLRWSTEDGCSILGAPCRSSLSKESWWDTWQKDARGPTALKAKFDEGEVYKVRLEYILETTKICSNYNANLEDDDTDNNDEEDQGDSEDDID